VLCAQGVTQVLKIIKTWRVPSFIATQKCSLSSFIANKSYVYILCFLPKQHKLKQKANVHTTPVVNPAVEVGGRSSGGPRFTSIFFFHYLFVSIASKMLQFQSSAHTVNMDILYWSICFVDLWPPTLTWIRRRSQSGWSVSLSLSALKMWLSGNVFRHLAWVTSHVFWWLQEHHRCYERLMAHQQLSSASRKLTLLILPTRSFSHAEND